MPQLVTSAEAAQRRFHLTLPNGTETWVNSYLGMTFSEARSKGIELQPGDKPQAMPVGYLVEQAARSQIPGHFHQAEEFQIFVDAGGKFGTHPIRPCLHYAGAFTPYPPIVAADVPLRYFTLRAAPDPGAMVLPEQKELLKAAKKPYRHHLIALDLQLQATRDAAVTRALIEPEDDGLAAWLMRVPAGRLVSAPSPRDGRGQFLLVLAGRCRIGEQPAGALDLAFVEPSESGARLEAGTEGALVAIMQFARVGLRRR